MQIERRPLELTKLAGNLRERVMRNLKTTAKTLLPPSVVHELQQYRAFEKTERPVYLKIRVWNGIGLANPRRSRPPKTARSFVFVCFGNIMRSPMCEALMNRALAGFPNPHIRVTSAGLNAVPGTAAHPWAVAAAKEFGISLEKHRARLLTSEMVDQADAIFAMDYQNQVQLMARYSHASNKVFMLSAYVGNNYDSIEIRDPYYIGREGTRRCYQILDACIQNLAGSLSGAPQRST